MGVSGKNLNGCRGRDLGQGAKPFETECYLMHLDVKSTSNGKWQTNNKPYGTMRNIRSGKNTRDTGA